VGPVRLLRDLAPRSEAHRGRARRRRAVVRASRLVSSRRARPLVSFPIALDRFDDSNAPSLPRRKSLRIGVHLANAVVWGPVYRTHLPPSVPPRALHRSPHDRVRVVNAVP
jgi:hypothetical protein